MASRSRKTLKLQAVLTDIDELEVTTTLFDGIEENWFKSFRYSKYKLSVPRAFIASAQANGFIAFSGGISFGSGPAKIHKEFDNLVY